MLLRRLPYIAVFAGSLYIITVTSTWAYYRFMPASWFIDIRGTPKISNGTIDSTLTLTLCRDTRYPNIQAVGARSYYVILDGKRSPAGNYSFTAKIEHSEECQYIPIQADKHPNKAGTYLAHTDLTFYVEGYKKVLGYQTDTFQLSDTRKSLQEQIQQLEQKIEELRSQQSAVAPTESTVAAQEVPSVSVPAVVPEQTSQPSAPTPDAPTTSAPPEPGLVTRVLNGITSLF